MNDEYEALATYLDRHLDKRFRRIDGQFKEVHRRINVLIDHVDGANDKQDDRLEDHELRIITLESDFRVLTS